jgi:hypothetical protein
MAKAQSLAGRVHGGWGTNLLLSPGEDVTHSPGRTGHVGLALTYGKPDQKVLVHSTVRLTGSAYRTRMAYQVWFVSQRNTMEMDLMAGFRQMNRTILQVGVFAGRTTRGSAIVEQGRKTTVQPLFPDPRVRTGHFPNNSVFGVTLGMAIPLDPNDRFGLEFQIRQHLLPFVDAPQSLALPFQPEELVLADNTKASILLVAVSYRFL